MLFVHTCVCANDPKSKIIGSNPNLVLSTKQVSQTGVLKQLLATIQPNAYNWEPSKAGETYILEGRLPTISSQKQEIENITFENPCLSLQA